MIWHPEMPDAYKDAILTGDCRELAKAMPDESVDLVLTDPVYSRIEDYRWLAETASRVLKPGGDVLAYLGMYQMGPIVAAMMPHLDYRWLLSEKKMTGGALIWSYRLFAHVVPLLWFTKGKPRDGLSRVDFRWAQQGQGANTNHDWGKNESAASYWLARFGLPSDIIWEPFAGGGSHVAAAKLLGRHYVAFEIDPATADRARLRVEQTQPPLFVPTESQLSLDAVPS